MKTLIDFRIRYLVLVPVVSFRTHDGDHQKSKLQAAEMMSSTTTTTTEKWNQTASSYVVYFEPTTLVMGRFMLNCLKLQYQSQPLLMLEAGAGAGGLARELLRLDGLSLDHLYVTDISEGMLQQAQIRLEGFDKVTVERSDSTAFQYAPDTFDRYYSNMCLHYADDPDTMIKECHRLLKPGGIAGFTIWGRRDDSPLFTIVPAVLDDLGLCPEDPSKRAGFHMGQDDDALRQRFQAFSKCMVMHVPVVVECLDAHYFCELIINGAASTKKQVESFRAEDQERVRNQVVQRVQSLLDQGTPIAIDTIVIVVQK